MKRFLFWTAIIILFALAFHLIVFDHHHSQELFGEGWEAAFHTQDKKVWFIVILAYIAFEACLLFSKKLINNEELPILPRLRSLEVQSEIFDLFVALFSQGILKPKIYNPTLL